jgi:hypothetical protein
MNTALNHYPDTDRRFDTDRPCWHCRGPFEQARPEGGLCRTCYRRWLSGYITLTFDQRKLLASWLYARLGQEAQNATD